MENNLLDNCYTNVLDFIYYYTIPPFFLFVLILKIKKYKIIYNFIFITYIKFFQTKSSVQCDNTCSLKHPKRFWITEYIFIPIIIKLSFYLRKDDKILFDKIKLLSMEEFYLLDCISKLMSTSDPLMSISDPYFIFDRVSKGFFNFNRNAMTASTKEVEILKRLDEKHFIVFNDKQKNINYNAPFVQVIEDKLIQSSYYVFFDEDGKKIDGILKSLKTRY